MLSSILIKKAQQSPVAECSEDEVNRLFTELKHQAHEKTVGPLGNCGVPQFYFKQNTQVGSAAYFLKKYSRAKDIEDMMAELAALMKAVAYQCDYVSPTASFLDLEQMLASLNLANSPFNFQAMFMQQMGSISGSICCSSLWMRLFQRLQRCRMKQKLQQFDSDVDDHLTKDELADFFVNIAEEHNWQVPPDFMPAWKAVVPRKVLFLLGRNGLVSIDRLLSSDMMAIFEVKDVAGQYDNFHEVLDWFSPWRIHELYERFAAIDEDGDGMLTPPELAMARTFTMPDVAANTSTMVPYFVERCVEVHATGVSPDTKQQAMNMDDFVDFTLAWQFRGTPPGIRYFFKALDVEHRNKLSGGVVLMWLTEMKKVCVENLPEREFRGDTDFDPADLKDEFFDMAKDKKRNDFIHLKDLLSLADREHKVQELIHITDRAQHAGEICCVLCDALSYIRRDCGGYDYNEE